MIDVFDTYTTSSPQHSPVTPDVVWRTLRAELAACSGVPWVIDIGGGTGGFAVELAHAGAQVLVVDPSPDALAALGRRAADRGVSDAVVGKQGDAAQLGVVTGGAKADLVLCHSVLEFVDDPVSTLAQLGQVVKPGGALSVLVANGVGEVLALVAAGQFEQAKAALAGRLGGGRRSFSYEELSVMLRASGFVVEQAHGVRIFSGLSGKGTLSGRQGLSAGSLPDPAAARALRELESACADKPSYRDVAAQLHLLGRWGG